MAFANYSATRDLYIKSDAADTTYGTDKMLHLLKRQSLEERVLLEFWLHSLPSTAYIQNATLRLYLMTPGASGPFNLAYEEDPPPIAASVGAGIQPYPFELRFLTQRFQNTATWNRHQADRFTYSSSTSTSGTGHLFSTSGTSGSYLSYFQSTSSGGLPGTHEWPGGPGAYGDTIADGAVEGNLPTSAGWVEIPCRDLVEYGMANNSKVVGLYLAKTFVTRGRWEFIASENYNASSGTSASSGVAQALTPELHVWWQQTVSSDVGSASSGE